MAIEAEIDALSCCCHELFSVMDSVWEVGNAVGLPTKELTSIHLSLHEDIAGALVLAETIPLQFTPWSQYYAIKTDWFCEENIKEELKCTTCIPLSNWVIFFTKVLQQPQFEYLRK